MGRKREPGVRHKDECDNHTDNDLRVGFRRKPYSVSSSIPILEKLPTSIIWTGERVPLPRRTRGEVGMSVRDRAGNEEITVLFTYLNLQV